MEVFIPDLNQDIYTRFEQIILIVSINFSRNYLENVIGGDTMRTEDALYFSFKYKILDINFDNKTHVIDAFKSRINDFYIKPAIQLVDNYFFAAGLLSVCTIDLLARYEFTTGRVGERFINWINTHIKEFNIEDNNNPGKKLSNRFYLDFRNGLVHEGRIKGGSQFSNFFPDLITLEGKIMVINVRVLITSIEHSFNCFIEQLTEDDEKYKLFKSALLDDFKIDLE